MPRNFKEARYNRKVYKVHLGRDELRHAGLLSDEELLSLEEIAAEEDEGRDAPSIDDPSYDFIKKLSELGYGQK